MKLIIADKKPLIIIVLIACLFGLYSLNRARLGYSIPDEKRYIQSTKEMAESGDYITPRYHGDLRFQKPILFYWLIVLSYKLFGVGMYGARFPSIAAALLNVILAYLLGRGLFSEKAGIFSALVLSTSELYYMYSGFATPDMTFILFITASIYLFLKAYHGDIKGNFKYLYMYIPMALAILTKGPLGFLFPMLTVCLFLILRGDRASFKELKFTLGLLVLTAINAPWFIAMVVLHGNKYLGNMWAMEIVKKVKYFSSGTNTNLLIHYFEAALYYIGMIFARHLPWSAFLPASLVWIRGSALWNPEKQDAAAVKPWSFTLIAAWFLTVFILLVLIWSKESYYVLGLSMPLSLFIGEFFSRLTDDSKLSSSILFKLPFIFAIAVSALGILLWLGFSAYILDKPIFSFSLAMFALPAFMTIAYLGKNKMLLPLSLFAAAFVFYAYFAGSIVPAAGEDPLAGAAEKIKSVIKGGDLVGVASSDKVSYHRLNAYLNEYKVIRVVENRITSWDQQRDIINSFLTPKSGRAFCVITKDDYYEYVDEELQNRLYILDKFFVWKKFHSQTKEYFIRLVSYFFEGKRELLRQSLKEEVYLISNMKDW